MPWYDDFFAKFKLTNKSVFSIEYTLSLRLKHIKFNAKNQNLNENSQNTLNIYLYQEIITLNNEDVYKNVNCTNI